MSAIPIHTDSPISPAKATAITPKTNYNQSTSSISNPSSITQNPESSTEYPSARPGAAAPTPTPTRSVATTQSPPPPQPGATPNGVAAAPSPARGLSIPPPPKAGEKPQPPAYYAKSQAQPSSVSSATTVAASPQTYPPQTKRPTPTSSDRAMSPAPTSSATQTPSFSASASSPSDSLSNTARSRANTLEHPPGYVQDPRAQEMTPIEQQASGSNGSERSPVLPGYHDSNRSQNAGFGEEEGIWDIAKKYVNQAGEKVQEIEGEIWRKFGDGK